MVLLGAILVGCTGSEDTLQRADFVDDPIFLIEIDGLEPEPLLAGPIGSRVTNDRGYRAERIWDGVDGDAFLDLVADLVAADVTFHRAACRDSATTLDGGKTLGSGVFVSVTARHGRTTESASVQVTGLEPDRDGASLLLPPQSVEIDEACDPELLAAAGLI